jgi:hypothetical protein
MVKKAMASNEIPYGQTIPLKKGVRNHLVMILGLIRSYRDGTTFVLRRAGWFITLPTE